MPYYAFRGSVTTLINLFDGKRLTDLCDMYLTESKDGLSTIKVDLPRVPFLGTNHQWQTFTTNYTTPNLTEFAQYVQGNMDSRGIVSIISEPPYYKPFMPKSILSSEEDAVKFIMNDKSIGYECAYMDDDNQCCGLHIIYDDPLDPKRWTIILVKGTNLGVDKRQLFMLSTEKLFSASNESVNELTNANDLHSVLIPNLGNQKLCAFIESIVHDDGSIVPQSNIIDLFFSRGKYTPAKNGPPVLSQLTQPNLYELLPHTAQEFAILFNNEVLQWLSTKLVRRVISSNILLPHHLQSIMSGKGVLYDALKLRLENTNNPLEVSFIQQTLEQVFNNPVLQNLIHDDTVKLTPTQLQRLMSKEGNFYQVFQETLQREDKRFSKHELIQLVVNLDRQGSDYAYIDQDQLDNLLSFFKRIEVDIRYTVLFGATNCALINRLVASEDPKTIQNLRITIDYFIEQVKDPNREPLDKQTHNQLKLFETSLSYIEEGIDPARAHREFAKAEAQEQHVSRENKPSTTSSDIQLQTTTATQSDGVPATNTIHLPRLSETLSFLEDCGFDRGEFDQDHLEQNEVCRRLLSAVKDYLSGPGNIPDEVSKKALINFILATTSNADIKTEPLATVDEALPQALQLEFRYFSENCLSGIAYERFLNFNGKSYPSQSLQSIALMNFGKVLNHLKLTEKLVENVTIPKALYGAFISINDHEAKLLNESFFDQLMAILNQLHTKDDASIENLTLVVKLLLTTPSLSTLLLKLPQESWISDLRDEKKIELLCHFSRLYTLLPDILTNELNVSSVKKLEDALAQTISALVEEPNQVDFDQLLIQPFEKENNGSLGKELKSYLLYIAEIAAMDINFERKNAMITLMASNDIKGKQFFNAIYTTRLYLDEIETHLQAEVTHGAVDDANAIFIGFKDARKESEIELFKGFYDLLNREKTPSREDIKTTIHPKFQPILNAIPKEKHPWLQRSVAILVNSLSIILTLGIANIGKKLSSGSYLFFHHDPQKQLKAATDELSELIRNKPKQI